MEKLKRRRLWAYFSQITWTSEFLAVLAQLSRLEDLWKPTHMLLNRNLCAGHAPTHHPGIPRFRHSYWVFCFLKSQRENGKDTHFLALQTLEVLHCQSQEGSLPASHLQRPPSWDGSWAVGNSPIRGGVCLQYCQDGGCSSGPPREKCSDARMGEGNFIKYALSKSFGYQSCSRKTPTQQVSAASVPHCIGQVKIPSVSETRKSSTWASTSPDLSSLGGQLCSKGCFSHWTTE